MPQITLGSGPTKASLVEGAYEFCGLNGFEYERTPEEMSSGLIALNDLMAGCLADGIDLTYTFPTYGNGLLEELSGIPTSAAAIVKKMLAQVLCPGLGGSLSDDAKAALSLGFHKLQGRYAATPASMVPMHRLPSSGVRHLHFTVTPTTTSP